MLTAESTLKVLDFLKQHPDEEFSNRDLSRKLDISSKSMAGALQALSSYGFIDKRKIVEMSADNKPYFAHYVQVTQDGMNYDPVEEERKLEQEKIEARAARRRARRDAANNIFIN